MAYNVFYMPSLGYGTSATILSKRDCEEIQRQVVNAILPKMGIARTAPRSVVFGTAQYGGLGLTHLAALQGHTCLQYLLGHLRCGDATGCLMQMLLEYTQLECGLSWKSTRTRLQQLLSSSHKYELDHGRVGTPTDVQGNSGY
jgi:hypothetical protein